MIHYIKSKEKRLLNKTIGHSSVSVSKWENVFEVDESYKY